MKKVYLVRHGETLFNTKYVMQGVCDSPLTPNGHEQSKAAGNILKGKNIVFDHAYCSTLRRTEETLQDMIDMPYQRTDGLLERDYGKLEGESRRITDGLTTEQRNQLYEVFGVEPVDHVTKRITAFLTELMEKEDHYSVLCVSHGSVVSYFLHSVAPDGDVKRLKNCHILEFEYDGNFHFVDSYFPENG